ncbi:hypothetical protein [Inediibacterium massiliense]|uniref:hypothetical protein n=1 Tax=Inediibacterium massiliense TaxID=1658111 RepID=UPI0006B684AA|nr:hypothetical protein [Inediibacterium massiliense]
MKINVMSPNSLNVGEQSKEVQLKAGQIIQGKICEILEDMIMLKMSNGKMLSAKLEVGLNAGVDESFKFQIKEANEKQILLTPILEGQDHIENEIENKIMDVLKGFEMKGTKEEISLIQTLIKNEIPVTKENVTGFMQMKSAFQKMENMGINPSIQDLKLEEPIIEVFKNIIKSQSENNSIEQNNTKNLENNQMTDHKVLIGNKELIQKQDSIDHKDFVQKQEILKNLSENEGNMKYKDIGIQNMDDEKIVFLSKNNLTVNLGNAIQLNRILYKDDPIGKQIDHLMKNLYENEKTVPLAKEIENILGKIKNMVETKDFKPQEIFKELYAKLETIKSTIEGLDKKEGVLNQIDQIKDGLDFMNKLNQSQAYVQIPIPTHKEYQNMDLLIVKDHKSKKKIDPNHVKLLISLDTKNMGQVRTLIDIKEKNITCNFKLIEDKIKEIFLKNEEKLKESLERLGYHSVYVQYGILNEESIVGDLISSKKFTNFIDLKV